MLEKTFKSVDIPVKEIVQRMHAVLPYKYSPHHKKPEPLDAPTLKKEIIRGGSHLYEKLIEVLRYEPRHPEEGTAYPLLSKRLASHGIPQLYRYVWIWSDDGSVIAQGCSWFADRDDCLNKGKSARPGYDTFDGPGAPMATLCVEAVTPCNVFKAVQGNDKNTEDVLMRVENMCCAYHI